MCVCVNNVCALMYAYSGTLVCGVTLVSLIVLNSGTLVCGVTLASLIVLSFLMDKLTKYSYIYFRAKIEF